MYITGSTITKNYAPTKYQSSGGGAGVASAGDTSTETVVANSIISDNSSNCSSGSDVTHMMETWTLSHLALITRSPHRGTTS